MNSKTDKLCDSFLRQLSNGILISTADIHIFVTNDSLLRPFLLFDIIHVLLVFDFDL